MNRLSAARIALAAFFLVVIAWLGWAGGPSSAFDRDTVVRLAALRQSSPELTEIAIALTWLGSAYLTLGGVAAASVWRLAEGDRACALWAFATVAGGRAVAEVVKYAVGRPRPHFTPWPVPVSSLSFPSGHATNSMLGLGVLVLLLAPRRRWPLAGALAVLLSVLIGLTRPYLGVHWPSDVVAGWLLGGAVLVVAGPFRPRASPAAT